MEGRKIDVKKVEDITKKYISRLVLTLDEYIKCQICKSTNTIMDKNKNSRMLEMICQKCQSKRTVLPIKSSLATIKK